MDGSGFHIALSRDHSKKLFGLKDDDSIRSFVEELKTSPDMKRSGRVLDTGTAWNAIHRCLTDGELDPGGGDFPLNHLILGGKQLLQAKEYAAVLIRPDITPFIDSALADIQLAEFRKLFQALPESYAQPRGEKEFGEVWRQLQRMRVFFEDCAQNREAVLFTVKLPENAAAKSA